MTQHACARIFTCIAAVVFAGLYANPVPADLAVVKISAIDETNSYLSFQGLSSEPAPYRDALAMDPTATRIIWKSSTAQGYGDAIKYAVTITAAAQQKAASAVSSEPGLARFFTINQVLAKGRNGDSAAIRLAAIEPRVMIDAEPSIAVKSKTSGEPFSLFTFRAPEGLLWLKWRGVEAAIQAEAPALAECRANLDTCTPATARFASIIKQAQALHGRERLTLVNDRVNASIRYVSDIEQWHVADLWSAPLETDGKGSFDTGLGDCEDYAIAKYVALREAGTPVQNLRLLLVRDNVVHADHAVLAVREENHWLILDNRWSVLTADTELQRFIPLFALNDEGVKLFAAPYATGLDHQVNSSSFDRSEFSAGRVVSRNDNSTVR